MKIVTFCKHNGLGKNDKSSSLLIRHDAVAIDRIMSIDSTFLHASSYTDVETGQLKKGVDLASKPSQSRKGILIPQECARRLLEGFPSAAVNVPQQCLKRRRMYVRDSHQHGYEKVDEIPVASCGTRTEGMNNSERSYTLCYKYLQTKYFCTALAVFVLKEFISDWVGDILNWLILHTKSSD